MWIKRFFFGIIKYTALFISLMVVGAVSTFITLRLFTSGDEVAVPDLVGKDPVEAVQQLNQDGLQLKILPQKRFHDKIPAEKIVAQDPIAGTKIKQGRSIEVYLSLGPEKVIVPDLVGQTTRVAGMTLGQYQLQPGRVMYVAAPGAQPDAVIAQYPLAGTEVTSVRAVNLLANNLAAPSNEVYVMPDLIGRSSLEVSEFMRTAGFRVGSPQPIDYPGVTPGTVVKQAPPAGYKIGKDTVISIYVSK